MVFLMISFVLCPRIPGIFLGDFTEKLKRTNLQGRDIENPCHCFVGEVSEGN